MTKRLKYWNGTIWDEIGSAQSATIIVSASNSKNKDLADYICTGSSDQTTINSAIAALPAGGGKIILLDGLYVVSGNIEITISNTVIEGQGDSTIIQMANGIVANTYIFNSQTATISGVSISDLKIDGNKANQTAGVHRGFYFIRTQFLAYNVNIVNFRNEGVYMPLCNNSIIENCIISGTGTYGICLSDSTDNFINNNTVSGITGAGINLAGASISNTISNNNTTTCSAEGIYLSSTTANQNTIAGNVVHSNSSHGITIGSSNNSIIGNVCKSNTQNGIYLAGATYNTVESNICQSNSVNGIYLYSGSNNNAVTGNILNGNFTNGITCYTSHWNTISGNKSVSHQIGIELSSSSYCTIVSNQFNVNSQHGLYLLNSTHCSASANSITDSTQNGLYLSGSGFNAISGNMIFSNSQYGIYLNNSSDNTVSANSTNYNTWAGIELDSSKSNVISNNTSKFNGTYGINLSNSSDNVIAGNNLVSNSQSANGSADNIQITTTSNTNNIQGNTCRKGTTTNLPRFGININTSNCTGNLMTNNDLTLGGTTGAFNNSGTSTITAAGNKLS